MHMNTLRHMHTTTVYLYDALPRFAFFSEFMYMCTCDIGSNRHAGTAHMTTEVLLSDLISTAFSSHSSRAEASLAHEACRSVLS